ncbi:MAG: hypothetical protein V4576_04155 [Patescibacteria group bacterium]
MKESVQIYRAQVDTKLIIRQRIFMIIICVLMAINIGNVVHKNIGVTLATEGFLISTIVGLFLSRMFKIFWHEEKAKVVSRLDTVGVIMLIGYIIFEVSRNQILGHFLSGNKLAAFSLIVLTGLLLGRFLGTLIRIKEILASEGMEPDKN